MAPLGYFDDLLTRRQPRRCCRIIYLRRYFRRHPFAVPCQRREPVSTTTPSTRMRPAPAVIQFKISCSLSSRGPTFPSRLVDSVELSSVYRRLQAASSFSGRSNALRSRRDKHLPVLNIFCSNPLPLCSMWYQIPQRRAPANSWDGKITHRRNRPETDNLDENPLVLSKRRDHASFRQPAPCSSTTYRRLRCYHALPRAAASTDSYPALLRRDSVVLCRELFNAATRTGWKVPAHAGKLISTPLAQQSNLRFVELKPAKLGATGPA